MSWFDAGVNVFDARMPAEETVGAALAAGVNKLCLITTHPEEWPLAEQYYQQFPQILCYTLGVHPHNAKVVQACHWEELVGRAASPGVVAIGECGLDFNRDFSPQNVQKEVFVKQLDIASQLNLPVYLHERDAFAQQLECITPYLSRLKGAIAHCFTGNAEQMHRYLSCGFYIGITGWICDPKRGEALRNAVLTLPLERLILETDAPYLYPKTRKPKQRNNAPAYLPHIGEFVSELKGVEVSNIAAVTYGNTKKLFEL